MPKRSVYFVSDGTGLTAASLGQSLLTQFEQIEFDKISIPYIDNSEKLNRVVDRINSDYQQNGIRPIVFTTLTDSNNAKLLGECQGLVFNLFQTFLSQLEAELNSRSTHRVGKTHGISNEAQYNIRMDAVNFTMNTDDGANPQHYHQADLIILGASRCGKTPTSLYLALQFGTYAANYPITEDDFPLLELPACLKEFKHKIFGLTIDVKRLSSIRSERRPNSQYASLNQCEKEIKAIEQLFLLEAIPNLNTTSRSIEEIATLIINEQNLERRLY